MSKKDREKYNTQFNKGETTMANNSNNDSAILDKPVEAVKDVKPATSFAPIAAAAPSQPIKQTAAPKINTNVAKLEKLIKDFEKTVEEDKAKDQLKAILVFISISEYLNKTNDPAVFEYFFKYFLRNREGYMFYETALNGVHTIQNKNVKTRVSATHAVFLELVRVRGLQKATYHYTIDAMKLMRISETLGQWIIEKARTRI